MLTVFISIYQAAQGESLPSITLFTVSYSVAFVYMDVRHGRKKGSENMNTPTSLIYIYI